MGALVPHSRVLLVIGAVAMAVAGFFHLRDWLHDRSLRRLNLPFMAVTVSPLEQAFDPTKPVPILQWNPDAVTGVATYAIALLIGVAIALVYHFGWNWLFRNRDSSWRSW